MDSRRISWPGRLAVLPLAMLSLATIMLTGCGSKSSDNNSSTNSPTSTATATAGDTAAICRDVDALKSSVSDLRDIKLNSDAVPTLRRMADQISAQLDQLKADAHGSLRPQIDKVSAAVKVLETNLSNAVSSPSAETLTVIPGAIKGVTSSVSALRTALPDC